MRFLAAIVSRQGFVALLLSALLAACTVVVDEGPRPRPPRPHPQLCTMQYEPVCARRGGDRQTFANACQAERAGYRIVREGPCRDGGGGSGAGGGEQTFCTREYAPVCARRYGEVRTFPNACEARAADYRIIGDGPC
ncbi:Kazal-type serine protease inhibitor domain-containing protein [Mesorhizobium sp.]|uniref:Kazal-type serine protease inhibitor domain-containing protein n=1 Tax=Mesorhizobium sp. TaxID=1871066 RepID=UPI000FE62382|nr:Kazal-type serine protease inhibitor domain-containing protein [Mesorhizobium sp.]RWB58877.1 MAG: peptidase [Mesorhizobium sp.]